LTCIRVRQLLHVEVRSGNRAASARLLHAELLRNSVWTSPTRRGALGGRNTWGNKGFRALSRREPDVFVHPDEAVAHARVPDTPQVPVVTASGWFGPAGDGGIQARALYVGAYATDVQRQAALSGRELPASGVQDGHVALIATVSNAFPHGGAAAFGACAGL